MRAGDPGLLDHVVREKLRRGQPGALTLAELERASDDALPRQALRDALQMLVNRLAREHPNPRAPGLMRQGSVSFELFGADVVLIRGEEDWLVVEVRTEDIDQNMTFDGEIPKIRFYVNESWVEVNGETGGWLPDAL
jgi:hypothetical protein